MPLSLNNSKDIVANSVSVLKGNRTIDVLETIDSLTGLAPATLNSLEKLADALNKDSVFFTTVTTALDNKADKSTTYTQSASNLLLDAKVDGTEMTNYALKTDVTAAVSTKQATLSNGTAITNSKAILSGSTIKNIVPGIGSISLTSDENNITITGINAYTVDQVNTKFSDLIGTAPAVLDTLQEIATSMGNNGTLSSSLINSIETKANTSDTFTKCVINNDVYSTFDIKEL